jgi:hypothetical protein
MAVAFAAASAGALTALHYHRLGLTLSHYDARGHLVVARRIIDSITPGWQQIGAVWLPLPHLLNAIPVQIDFFYRTGASAVAISVLSFAIAAGAITWIVLAITDSQLAAVAAATVFALNPNVLYLQSTPMTEPLLLALTLLGVAMLTEWVGPKDGDAGPVGWVLALACLTRYEAWPVTTVALTGAAWARWRRGEAIGVVARDLGRVALYPAVALVGFAIFSRIVGGHWFVGGDFFVAENKALGDRWLAVKEIVWGTRTLSGPLLVASGLAGLGAAIAIGLTSRARASAIVAASVVAMAAIPWAAFVKGHPFRIRYMVPLVAAEAIGAGVLVGLSRRTRVACAIAVLAVVAYELRPLDAGAPMIVEAQWDRPNAPVRAQVTACLGRPERGVKIMASMGSLGHYMQEASRAGFGIGDFLHEGNGDLWLTAVDGPYPFAQWILIEEKAEGGDMLARIAREHPHFLDGYRRVCEGAGLALYQRQGSGHSALGSRHRAQGADKPSAFRPQP